MGRQRAGEEGSQEARFARACRVPEPRQGVYSLILVLALAPVAKRSESIHDCPCAPDLPPQLRKKSTTKQSPSTK